MTFRPVLAAVLLSASFVEAQESAPSITCEQPTFDFGSASSSQTISHEFVLKNTGNADLTIGAVRPACGCTVASISARTIAPGGETRVTASLNLAGRQGAQHKSITIDSNDPKQPQYTLMLSGTVAESVTIQPQQLIFGQLNATSAVAAEVIVTSGNGQPFTVKSAGLELPFFTTEIITREEKKTYAVVVKTKSPLPNGTHQAMLNIETDSPARPSIPVLVAATVVGELAIAPSEITIAEQAGQTATRFIVVRSTTGTAFPAPTVEVPDPSIQVEVAPFGATGYRIQLSGLPASNTMNGREIIVRTAVESMKEIRIPLRVVTPSG